jgi:hypothetical protein
MTNLVPDNSGSDDQETPGPSSALKGSDKNRALGERLGEIICRRGASVPKMAARPPSRP